MECRSYLFVLFILIQEVLSIDLDYSHSCPSHTVCVNYDYCHYEGTEILKRCKEEFVCCPKRLYYDAYVNKEYKEQYEIDSYPRKYRRPLNQGEDGYYPSYRYETDFYDNEYHHDLSKEALKAMNSYDEKECGVRKSYHGKISFGHETELGVTKYGEFPWQVALLVKIKETKHKVAYKYQCAASVINPSLLITAAHCVKGMDVKKLIVKLGDWNLKGSYGELFPTIERKIKKIFIHDYYEPKTYVHDIAILVLHKPVNLRKTPHVSPVCLPPGTLKFDEYSKCYIVGWGNNPYKPNYGSNLLKVAAVNLLKKDCHHKLKKAISSVNEKYFKKDISCIISHTAEDSCIGDGGGAVVCPISNKEVNICEDYHCYEEHYFLAGIISWGNEECGKGNSVTVVTNVEKHLEWIKEKAKSFGGLHYMYDQYDEKFFYGYKDNRYDDYYNGFYDRYRSHDDPHYHSHYDDYYYESTPKYRDNVKHSGSRGHYNRRPY